MPETENTSIICLPWFVLHFFGSFVEKSVQKYWHLVLSNEITFSSRLATKIQSKDSIKRKRIEDYITGETIVKIVPNYICYGLPLRQRMEFFEL